MLTCISMPVMLAERNQKNHTRHFSRNVKRRRKTNEKLRFFFNVSEEKFENQLTNNQNCRFTHLSTKEIHFLCDQPFVCLFSMQYSLPIKLYLLQLQVTSLYVLALFYNKLATPEWYARQYKENLKNRSVYFKTTPLILRSSRSRIVPPVLRRLVT